MDPFDIVSVLLETLASLALAEVLKRGARALGEVRPRGGDLFDDVGRLEDELSRFEGICDDEGINLDVDFRFGKTASVSESGFERYTRSRHEIEQILKRIKGRVRRAERTVSIAEATLEQSQVMNLLNEVLGTHLSIRRVLEILRKACRVLREHYIENRDT